ncbi:MAG TPA: phosphate signaling complex protein PhoU [Acidimicrobiales bacterium]|nr:phosphate signaling complex protein PhoU [Acidimicrobiales bacterium]
MTDIRSEHRRLFNEELRGVSESVVKLGGLVERAVRLATRAFLDRDLSVAERVIAGDGRVNQLTRDIEEETYLILARQQPVAADLRLLVSVLRVIQELERSGDLMVNVAKATRRLYPTEPTREQRRIITSMGEQAAAQLRLAVDAFAGRDAVMAAALPDMDDAMDDLERAMFRSILSTPTPEDLDLQRAVQFALVGRFYERVADHAVNIGERVCYMVTGEAPPEQQSLTQPGDEFLDQGGE